MTLPTCCEYHGVNCHQGTICPERQPRTLRFITTPAGVRIGWAYVPKPAPLTHEQQRIQAALLEPRTAHPMTPLQRFFGAIWRWL